jgi:hypothetical protein
VAQAPRTAPCSPQEAKQRAAIASAYLETAESIMAERTDLRDANLSVAAGTAVLAGIAAADAICGFRLGKIHRGEDHRGAADLLRTATHDGKGLSVKLSRLLDVKGQAHYGMPFISGQQALSAVRAARALVLRAREETERWAERHFSIGRQHRANLVDHAKSLVVGLVLSGVFGRPRHASWRDPETIHDRCRGTTDIAFNTASSVTPS